MELYRKAIAAAVVAILGLVGLFVTLDPNVAEAIGAVVVALANVGGVFYFANTPARAADGTFVQTK
jgi:uncharacterized membrane protein